MLESSDFCVEYGVENNYCDVTILALNYSVDNNILSLPSGDINRAELFGDPLPGILKHIRIFKNNQYIIYPDYELIYIDISDIDINKYKFIPNLRLWFDADIINPTVKLELIHKNLKFIGNIHDEYPEQLMSVIYIERNDRVLELGSNIGRNTLVIATLLNNQDNLITLESDSTTCETLRKNMQINGYNFNIENSALSYRKLIQSGWDTIPNEELLLGYKPVKSITFEELENKYDIKFNTIVADCEGALYYILIDNPSILNNITKIIMENDYKDIGHKSVVDDIIRSKGLRRSYFAPGPWGPCKDNFYEVWQK